MPRHWIDGAFSASPMTMTIGVVMMMMMMMEVILMGEMRMLLLLLLLLKYDSGSKDMTC